MKSFFTNPVNPLYAVLIFAVVWICGWAVTLIVPFFQREVAVEGAARVTPLDGLRGILCFGVMCHHAVITCFYLHRGIWDSPPSLLYTRLGETSVALFFCITAFLFWGRVVARRGDIRTYSFLRGRVFRLVPLYVFSCLLALVIAAVRYHVDWMSMSALNGLGRMALLGLRAWGPLGGVDMKIVDAGVVWSLKYEWIFYALIPVAALLVKARARAVLMLLMFGALIVFHAGPAAYFFPGIAAVYVIQSRAAVRWLSSPLASAGVVAAVAALCFALGNGFPTLQLILTGAVFVPIACGNSVFGLLTTRGLRLAGVISYSVYLLHGIVLFTAQPWLAGAISHRSGDAPTYWMRIGCLAVATFALSLLTYRFVEWPFIQYERGIRGTPPTERLVKQVVFAVPSTSP